MFLTNCCVIIGLLLQLVIINVKCAPSVDNTLALNDNYLNVGTTEPDTNISAINGRSFDSEHVHHNNTDNNNSQQGNLGPSATLHFLRKFGYLESQESNSSETLYSEEKMADAVKLMQKYGDIKQTGKLNEETLELLTKPRCGVPDVMKPLRLKRFAFGSKGWNKRQLTYRVENWSSKLRGEDVHLDLKQALDTWASYSHLRFVNKTGASGNVDINILFGRGQHGDSYPFDGPGGTLAHAFFPQNNPGLGGDMHFDEDENWYSPRRSWNNSRGISFLDVALHEMGHSLGLAHSHIRTSVMFPYYQAPKSSEPQLDYDDVMALYKLYIQRHIEDNGPDVETGSTWRYPMSPTTTARSTPTKRTSSTTKMPVSTTTQSDSDNDSDDKHPDYSTTTKTTNTVSPSVPRLCTDPIDTISVIRNELFVFHGQFMWRFKSRGQPVQGSYPVNTSRLFPIVKGLERIDAAFEREEDGKIIFISGSSYWTFDGSLNGDSGPHPLTDFGLPEDLEKIDAAFVWGKNKMTYFFKDDLYWKYNTTTHKLDEGYPKNIEKWRGVPQGPLTSVIVYYDNGKTYFFKGKEVWQFDDYTVHTEEDYPMNALKTWFNCP